MSNPIIVFSLRESKVIEVPKVKEVVEINNKVIECKVEHKK